MKQLDTVSALLALLKHPLQLLLLRALRDVYHRLDRIDSRHDVIDSRLAQIEPRTLSTRAYALQEICEYLTVIAFDDWGCFRNLPDKGEQRACRDWLERHPAIRLHELMSLGWNGKVFTGGAC